MYYSLWAYAALSLYLCSVYAPVCCRCSSSGAENPTQTEETRPSTDYVDRGLFSSLLGSSFCCPIGKIPSRQSGASNLIPCCPCQHGLQQCFTSYTFLLSGPWARAHSPSFLSSADKRHDLCFNRLFPTGMCKLYIYLSNCTA